MRCFTFWSWHLGYSWLCFWVFWFSSFFWVCSLCSHQKGYIDQFILLQRHFRFIHRSVRYLIITSPSLNLSLLLIYLSHPKCFIRITIFNCFPAFHFAQPPNFTRLILGSIHVRLHSLHPQPPLFHQNYGVWSFSLYPQATPQNFSTAP